MINFSRIQIVKSENLFCNYNLKFSMNDYDDRIK